MKFIDTTVSDAFSHEVALPESSMSLARAGLYFARSVYPNVDCGWYLGQLDMIADSVSARIDAEQGFSQRLKTLIGYMFDELGYHGNVDAYYDPRNSFINEVIDRRTGIPITLSVVFLEVAERINVSARGVPFPGHFLVSAFDREQQFIVDPFDQGLALERDIFLARLRQKTENDAPLDTLEKLLKPALKVDILLRQLRNLQAVYADKGEVEKALLVVNHMLTIDPDLIAELLHRAALQITLGHHSAAVLDFERVLALSKDANLNREVSERLRDARIASRKLH